MKTGQLSIDVVYDEKIANLGDIAAAMDVLLKTATSTVGVLAEYGTPELSDFVVVEEDIHSSPKQKLREILVAWHTDEVTNEAEAGIYADRFIRRLKEAGLAVVGEDEVQDALTFWRCPKCRHVKSVWAYELAEIGTPFCGLTPQCEEQEMEPIEFNNEEDDEGSEP